MSEYSDLIAQMQMDAYKQKIAGFRGAATSLDPLTGATMPASVGPRMQRLAYGSATAVDPVAQFSQARSRLSPQIGGMMEGSALRPDPVGQAMGGRGANISQFRGGTGSFQSPEMPSYGTPKGMPGNLARGNFTASGIPVGAGAANVVDDAAAAAAPSVAQQFMQGGMRGVATNALENGATGLAGSAAKFGLSKTGSGLAGAVVGLPVSMGLDALNIGGEGSNWDKYGSAAAGGAAGGAVVGGPIGALIGGGGALAITGLMDWLDGDGGKGAAEASPMASIDGIMAAGQQAGMDPESLNNINVRYQAAMAFAETDEEKAAALAAAKEETKNAAMAQASGGGQQGMTMNESYPGQDQDTILAMQGIIGEYMKPYTDGYLADAMNRAATIPDTPQGRMERDRLGRDAQRMAMSTMGAALATPMQLASERQAAYLKQQAQQMQSQMMSQSYGGSGDSTDMQALLDQYA